MSDIIDNRSEKLIDTINTILESTHAAHFAVGYFFLSGWEALADQLQVLGGMRLLIGNTSDSKTIEQLAEGYLRLEQVRDDLEALQYRRRADESGLVTTTAAHLADSIALMDQTNTAERLIDSLADMIEQGRLEVRVYTKGRLHAKAYIFDYRDTLYDDRGRPVRRTENGIGIVGSSNLSMAGISHNTELNVMVHGNDNHEDLKKWFDELWEEAQPFDSALMEEMQQSWARAQVRPYDIYMRTLYKLVADRVEGKPDDPIILWGDDIIDQLADFQKVAVRQAIKMINEHGGAFVSDVVGLGKSFIGAAILKHFERNDGTRALVICPAPLVDMWESYNEKYALNARVMSMGMLQSRNASSLLNEYDGRNFVLIDESHHFRNADTTRYKNLEAFLHAEDRKICLLTATPRNRNAWDVYHQIKLFHHDDQTDLPIEPPDLRSYFKLIESGERQLPPLLSTILVRRTRNHILRWYGYDSDTHQPIDPTDFRPYLSGERRAYVKVAGRDNFFPARRLQTVDYNIEATYQGLYAEIRSYLGKPDLDEVGNHVLKYARYGLWGYVLPAKREAYSKLQSAGANLRGLMRIMMFKRLESSVYAFTQTITRMIKIHEGFLTAIAQGIIPAGKDAQTLLYESDSSEEVDILDKLEALDLPYRLEDFDVEQLIADLEHDLAILQDIKRLVERVTPDQDDKLVRLRQLLEQAPITGNKTLIFTQYADTAQYLSEQIINSRKDAAVIYSNDSKKAEIVGRFAPKANPKFKNKGREINLLIATDVLAEGLNMQDGNIIINYDLHWNPVRLIQRFGRIDRIGTEHDTVYGFNFLPELGIEQNLGLQEKLSRRIQEIHDTIGEDAAILDETERLNEEALYAIYRGDGAEIALADDDVLGLEGDDQIINLNEAEEVIRQLMTDAPEEYERIKRLRNGIRTRRNQETGHQWLYVFCQAGDYRQLYLIDQNTGQITNDIPSILGILQAPPDERGYPVPHNHNEAVMDVKRRFLEDVQKRRSNKRKQGANLTRAQKYLRDELQLLYRDVEDPDERAQIEFILGAFTGSLIKKLHSEINLVRREGLTGIALLERLSQVERTYDLRQRLAAKKSAETAIENIYIICSEALT